jgi:hypothetical protein
VYYLYRYSPDGVLKGHVDKVHGIDEISEAPFGISGQVCIAALTSNT